MTPGVRTVTLAAGDAIALILFAVIGLLNHDHTVTVAGIARNAGPLLAGWFAAALLFGTYRHPRWRTFLRAWVLGVTGGVALRALILHRATDAAELTFLGVTLGATLVLLLLWRGLACAVERFAGRRAGAPL